MAAPAMGMTVKPALKFCRGIATEVRPVALNHGPGSTLSFQRLFLDHVEGTPSFPCLCLFWAEVYLNSRKRSAGVELNLRLFPPCYLQDPGAGES